MRPRQLFAAGAVIATAGLILTIGGAPLLVTGADHLDAPNLGAIHVNSSGVIDVLNLTHSDRDIADVYAFRGQNTSDTVLAMTTNPAVNVGGVQHFGSNVLYQFKIDTNGDAVPDVAYKLTFSDVRSDGTQHFVVKRGTGNQATGLNAGGMAIGEGATSLGSAVNAVGLAGGGMVYAGRRADPFFFDLLGFLGTVKGQGTRRLNDASAGDFFAGLDVMAIVLEVPTVQLGSHLGIWATTSYWNGSSWVPADQMGRPAINTVFNHGVGSFGTDQDKIDFNRTPPAKQRTAFGGKFRSNVVSVLSLFYADATTINGLADFLLPDVITYNTGSTANGAAFNGRALADDVIDAELAAVTNGAITTDSAGNGCHTYLSTFPYLSATHPAC